METQVEETIINWLTEIRKNLDSGHKSPLKTYPTRNLPFDEFSSSRSSTHSSGQNVVIVNNNPYPVYNPVIVNNHYSREEREKRKRKRKKKIKRRLVQCNMRLLACFLLD